MTTTYRPAGSGIPADRNHRGNSASVFFGGGNEARFPSETESLARPDRHLRHAPKMGASAVQELSGLGIRGVRRIRIVDVVWTTSAAEETVP